MTRSDNLNGPKVTWFHVVRLPGTKLLHWRRALSLSGRLRQKKYSFYENFYDSARWNVDTVVLGDVVDGLRGKFTGEGTDTHRSENSTAGSEVTPEGAA